MAWTHLGTAYSARSHALIGAAKVGGRGRVIAHVALSSVRPVRGREGAIIWSPWQGLGISQWQEAFVSGHVVSLLVILHTKSTCARGRRVDIIPRLSSVSFSEEEKRNNTQYCYQRQ